MLNFIPLLFVLLYQTEDVVYLKGRWQKREKMDDFNGYYVFKHGQASLTIKNQRLNFTYLCDYDKYQIQISNFSLAIDDTQIQHFDINFTRNPNNKYIQNINKKMMKNGPLNLIIKDGYFDVKIDFKTTYRFEYFNFVDGPFQLQDIIKIKNVQFGLMLVMMAGVIITSLMRYQENTSTGVSFQPLVYNLLYCWAINCESQRGITILIVILMFSYVYIHLVLVLNRNILNRSRLSIPKIIVAIFMMIMIKKSYLNESHMICASILMLFADYTARQKVFNLSQLSLYSQIQQIFLAVFCILFGYYKQQILFTDLYYLRIILFIFISALIQRLKRNLLRTIVAARRLK